MAGDERIELPTVVLEIDPKILKSYHLLKSKIYSLWLHNDHLYKLHFYYTKINYLIQWKCLAFLL